MSSKKQKLKLDTQKNWTNENILKCKMIGDRAAAYVWLTNRAADHYDFYRNVAEVLLIIFTYLFGAGGIPSLAITNDVTIIRIVNGIIQGAIILLGLCKSIFEWMNLTEKIKEYGWASAAHASLFIDIQRMLDQQPGDRRDFSQFHTQIMEKELGNMAKTPHIPSKIIRDYYACMGVKAIPKNVLFNEGAGEIELIDADFNYKSDSPTNKQIDDYVKKTNRVRDELTESEVKPKIKKTLSSKKLYELDRYFINYKP